MGSGLTLPFLLVYLHQVRGLDLDLAGLAVAFVAVASLVGNPLGGVLVDRVGARTTVLFGLALSALGAAALASVDGSWQAFTAVALVGLGAAVTWPSEDALLAVIVPRERRSHVFAVRFALLNAGFGIGGLLAAAVVDVDRPGTFTAIYLIDAVSFLLYAPILLTVSAPRRSDGIDQDGAPRGGGFRAVLRDSMFLRVWAVTALLVTVGYGQYHSGFPAYATRSDGISVRALGLVFAANTITVVFAQLVALKLLAGHRRTRAVMLVCVLWASTWAVTLAAGALGGGTAATVVFALAMVLFACGETLLPPSLPAIVNDLAPDELRGRYNGLYTLSWTTGFMVGPAVAGVALGAGLATPLFVGLIVTCAVVALVARAVEPRLPAEMNLIPAEPSGTPAAAGAPDDAPLTSLPVPAAATEEVAP